MFLLVIINTLDEAIFHSKHPLNAVKVYGLL